MLSLTAEKRFVPVGQDHITSPQAGLVSQGFFLVLVALCVAIIVFRINDVTRPGLWRLAILLAPWLWMLTRGAYSGQLAADAALYVLVVLALAALRPHPRVLQTAGVLVLLTALIAIGFGFGMPDAGILRESSGEVRVAEKATLPQWGLLQGMFTSENALGQFLSVGLPAVFLLKPWLRWPAWCVIVFAVYWTSSRSALLTVVVASAVAGMIWLLRALDWRAAASVVARAIIVGLVAVAAVVPFLGWPDDAFTTRGLIWRVSLEEWSDRAFAFGFGTDWYVKLTESETSPFHAGAYHGHSTVVQFLVTGGPILAVLGLGSLVVIAWRLTRVEQSALVYAAGLFVAILANGLLEVVIGYVDRSVVWMSTLVPMAVLLFAQPATRRRTETMAWR